MALVDGVRPAAAEAPATRGANSAAPISSLEQDTTAANAKGTDFTRSPGSSGRSLAGYAALALAFVACPCHLPLTLGIAAAVVGGTAGSAAVTQNLGTALALGATIFVVSLAAGLWLLRGREPQTL